MELLVLVLGFATCVTWVSSHGVFTEQGDTAANITQPGQDRYVIHATVYQVDILTNRTDNETTNFNSTGDQQSVTLYSTNGSNIDLSGIPEPILTNVTAQSVVGVAPVSDTIDHDVSHIWGPLKHLIYPAELPLGNANIPVANAEKPTRKTIHKRALDKSVLQIFKRDVEKNLPVKVVSGAVVIPPEAGVQSIGLPHLLALNNNFSTIPVPIPNTSVVHYATVNTLVQKP